MADDETTSQRTHGASTARTLGGYLLVIENDATRRFPLPDVGVVRVGRGEECELRVDHKSVSRYHARLTIDGDVVRIQDGTSRNGTKVMGEVVEGVRTISSGDVIRVGDVVLLFERAGRAPHPHHVLSEVDWRARLDEEIERALSFEDRSLAIVAIAGVAETALAPALDLLLRRVRGIDVVGRGDDGQLLVLLPETDHPGARAFAAETASALRDASGSARAGFVAFASDGIDADTLLRSARAAARGAPAGSAAGEQATEIDLPERRVILADPGMIELYSLLRRVAASDLPVLLIGETGVGKDNAAFAVHHWSKRSAREMVTIDCTSIPEALVESELFGYEKGAHSSATSGKAGRIELADGGTLFLDEIGELPLAAQAKLLRVLETKRLLRLGDSRERPADVRVVAATNRILEDEVEAGRFRRDLYYRLSGARVLLKPLRERRAEVPLLARELLAREREALRRPPMTIAPPAMQLLCAHAWPGNVRELKNLMQRLAVTVEDERVEREDVLECLRASAAPVPVPEAVTPAPIAPEHAAAFRPIADELAELERRRMVEALAAAGGVKTRAAQLIKMPIRTFTLKLRQYGIR
jgi:two-component system, NtrC family, response regulator AtoC